MGRLVVPLSMSPVESGDWLAANVLEMERREATWLEVLAEFDLARGWALDGQLCCADWLVLKARMARSTAYERLLVAHQLRRRPVLAEAFKSGRVSYSVVRSMARMEDPDPEVDEALIGLAQSGTVRDVERVVGAYRRCAEQERKPNEALERRQVRVRPNLDGTSTLQITLTDLEVEEFMAALGAFVDDQLANERHDPETADSEAGDESARADREALPSDDRATPIERPSWLARRADAVMEMTRVALAHVREGQAAGDDRYMVHIIAFGENMQAIDGTPIDSATAKRIACDSCGVEHLLGSDWEPLALGRKTRAWTTAQRRAIRVRDGGRCRFAGCYNRRVDIHHHEWWEKGGATDASNGFLLCDRHHTLLHHGYQADGSANAQLTFYRPDGTIIGSSSPRARTQLSIIG